MSWERPSDAMLATDEVKATDALEAFGELDIHVFRLEDHEQVIVYTSGGHARTAFLRPGHTILTVAGWDLPT